MSYWSRLYNGDLKVGNDYNTLNKTIAILIVNDTIKNLGVIKKFHTKWNLREETYTEIILTDYLEIHIIELPKYIQSKKSNNNVWLDFLLKPNEIRGMDAMEDSKMKKELEMVEEARKKWEEIIAIVIYRADNYGLIRNDRLFLFSKKFIKILDIIFLICYD